MSMRLALTPGEPAGIGPDLILRLAQAPRAHQWIVVADPDLLQDRARALDLPLQLKLCEDRDLSQPPEGDPAGQLRVWPVSAAAPIEPGRLDPDNAPYVLATLEAAVDGCLQGRFDALVTGPVHKGVINDAGVPFSGHTEFLCERTRAPGVLMVLMADALRVALVTTHVPLAQVPGLITRPRVQETLQRLIDGLQLNFGLQQPRVLVAGLNPHAGESGHLGREEIEVITPVCDAFREQGHAVVGPLPADTLFTPGLLQDADAVLAMYHDQGLPVLKHAGFGRAVNVSFGLPIVRTSVDHGTALDLAGTGGADAGSLAVAIHTAETMVRARARQGALA